MLNNHIPSPDPLPGIQDIFVLVNGQLTNNAEVLIGQNGGMIDACTVQGHDWACPFRPLDPGSIRRRAAEMARRGFTLREYRYYPDTPGPGQETHELVGYNHAGQADVRAEVFTNN